MGLQVQRIENLLEYLSMMEKTLDTANLTSEKRDEMIENLRLEVVDVLKMAFKEGDHMIRRSAIYGLSKVGVAESFDFFISALNDQDEHVRGWAAEALGKIKDSRSWFILLWLGVFVAAGALSESTPAAQRYVAAVPACMIVVAYAVNRLIEIGVRIWPRWEKRLTNVLLIGAMLVAMDDSRFYFLDYTPRSDFSGFNGQVAQHLANYLQDYDSSWEVVFYGWPTMGYYSIPSIAYLAPHIKGLDNFKPWGDPENPVPDRKNLMFVFLPDHEDEFYACQALYPDGEVWTEYGKNNLLLFYLYKVRLP
jgi:hypothetical protein